MIKLLPRSRSKKGASIALVVVCVFLCVLLICFCFNFGMIMGGSQQVRNAVDAAVLNVAKRVVESKVVVNSAFEDCADTSGQVGISNIARVWGKAMLINANAQEMVSEDTADVLTVPHAETSYNMATQINSNLADQVRD
ncbi:MAG: hypothetical protein K8F91_00900, partial [Candidatus Obscuribacterales bacterium]|nr:hypothetical protein [Candidatus Obscuribacterales bacterium]